MSGIASGPKNAEIMKKVPIIKEWFNTGDKTSI